MYFWARQFKALKVHDKIFKSILKLTYQLERVEGALNLGPDILHLMYKVGSTSEFRERCRETLTHRTELYDCERSRPISHP